MGAHEPEFAQILDALRGREPWPEGVDPETRRIAERLVARGLAVHSEAAVPKSALGKANRIFREAMKQSVGRPGLLRLVFDSWFQPAPALRRAGPDATRFLRYDGHCGVELQTREKGGGVELFGQVDPPDAATEVRIEIGSSERTAPIDAGGSFRFARLPRGVAHVQVGDSTIEGVPL